jgi:hypothetical protein
MKNIFGKVAMALEGRSGKINRRNELLVQREATEKPLKDAVAAAVAERKRLEDILGGYTVVAAQKNLERTMLPLNQELSQLTAQLQRHPPQAILNFYDECSILELQARALKDQKDDISSQDELGETLELIRYDVQSIDHLLEALREKRRDAADLSLKDLNAAELAKEIDMIRARPLPELRKKRYQRQSIERPWKEMAVSQ